MMNPVVGSLESAMFEIGQVFLLPVLAIIAILFLHAFYALGAFARQWWQRRRNRPSGFELIEAWRRAPDTSLAELEAEAVIRLERVRIATRVAPMFGLVATMIPLGPALKALGEGRLSDVSHGLMVAFSAIILALIAAAITYGIATVRKRWYATELLRIVRETKAGIP